jgi:hypothetical protein
MINVQTKEQGKITRETMIIQLSTVGLIKGLHGKVAKVSFEIKIIKKFCQGKLCCFKKRVTFTDIN